MEAERLRIEEREHAREAERVRTREQQLEEKSRNEAQAIQDADVNDGEKQRLMEEHEANIARLAARLADERQKSAVALEVKLAARRGRKAELARALVQRQAVLGWEDEERRRLNEKAAEDAKRFNDQRQKRVRICCNILHFE